MNSLGIHTRRGAMQAFGRVCVLSAMWLLPQADCGAEPPALLPPVPDVDTISDASDSQEDIPAPAIEHVPQGETELPQIEFPEDEPPLLWEFAEAFPTVLTWPEEQVAKLYGHLLHAEHVELETELEEEPIGLQPIPPRPPLILELNDLFLGPGFLNQGIETPTGAVWRPSVWVFGQYRTAFQYFDNRRASDPVVEWANRLDLFGQLNLTGTERVLVGIRPLDEERINRRFFTGYDFRDGKELDGWNGDLQTLFFEGDFGELFPRLDPYDSHLLDVGFSVGRMPILAQQGLLLNEDMIDAVTVTRNTLYGHGNLNLRATGFYAWDSITRNSPTKMPPPNELDKSSQMVGLLTESDLYHSMVNLDVVYVHGGRRHNRGPNRLWTQRRSAQARVREYLQHVAPCTWIVSNFGTN